MYCIEVILKVQIRAKLTGLHSYGNFQI